MLKNIIVTAVLVLLSILLINSLPLWHWLLFNIIYKHFVGLIVLVGLTIGAVILIATMNRRHDAVFGTFGAICLWAILLGGYFWWSSDVYGTALSQSFEPEKLGKQVPEISNIRYVPFEVAKTAAKGRQQDPTKQVGDLDPVIINNQFLWVAPSIPNGIGNWLSGSVDGLLVEQDNQSVSFDPQSFTCGEGMAFNHDVVWNLLSKRYRADYPEVHYIKTDKEWLAMSPYKTYRFVFPVFVPQWGGVMVVHSDCTIEDLPPEKAQADPRFKGQRLFPEELVRDYAKSWGYRFGGLANVLFYHQNDIEENPRLLVTTRCPTPFPPVWAPNG